MGKRLSRPDEVQLSADSSHATTPGTPTPFCAGGSDPHGEPSISPDRRDRRLALFPSLVRARHPHRLAPSSASMPASFPGRTPSRGGGGRGGAEGPWTNIFASGEQIPPLSRIPVQGRGARRFRTRQRRHLAGRQHLEIGDGARRGRRVRGPRDAAVAKAAEVGAAAACMGRAGLNGAKRFLSITSRRQLPEEFTDILAAKVGDPMDESVGLGPPTARWAHATTSPRRSSGR